MGLRSTAAQSSNILKPKSRKTLSVSPLSKKVSKRGEKCLTFTSKKAATKKDDCLEVLDYNIQMDFQLLGAGSIVDTMNKIRENQWAESTLFHDRYFSRETKLNSQRPPDLLFSLRGLSMEVKADIIKYREQQLPTGGMATVNQLYTLFESSGNTFVDRSLELSIRSGQIRKFVISNASPVISRTGKGGLNSQVTYGYENAEILVKTEHYLREIDTLIVSDDPESVLTLSKFKIFVEQNPSALIVTNEEFSKPEMTLLVGVGLLTLTSNYHFEIDVHQYSVAFPRCGTFLKMINSGRSWLVRALNKMTYKESLEDKLFDKWEGKSMTNFRRPFYGYDLLWILADAKGAGVVEAFSTPVGRGWRLTGKL